MNFDGKAFGEAVVGAVKAYLASVLDPLSARVRALEERPGPESGKDGTNGRDGVDGRPGAHGENGKDGADGRDGRDGQPGRDGANGADGKDGANGERGFSLDDFDTEMKDDRTVLLKFVRGDTVETHEIHFPVMIYRGVYSEETTYERGDTVTWGGAMFHCNGPEAEGEALGKPVEGSKAWTLAVKRGRDGKAGEKGADGKDGRDGKPGLGASERRAW